MSGPFIDRLTRAIREKQSRVVVGLDPRPELFPESLRQRAEAAGPRAMHCLLYEFCTRVIDAVAPHAVAVKPQIAFFERYGYWGLVAYAEAVACARRRGLLVIGDVKRGDIGSTAVAYARAHLMPDRRDEARCDVDAITVNPLFGTDGVQPFLDVAREQGKGLFVLVKTSNPSSAEIQDLVSEGRPVYEHIAALVHGWAESISAGEGWSPVGAVVGATWPEVAHRLRELMPRSVFLVPGYGAQGATAADVKPFFNAQGEGALVSASRSVIYAWRAEPYKSRFGEAKWVEAVAAASQTMREDIEEAVHT